jgi:hypothetical protein
MDFFFFLTSHYLLPQKPHFTGKGTLTENKRMERNSLNKWNPKQSVTTSAQLVCKYFTENFCVHVHQGNWSIISFLVYLSGFGIRVVLAL